MVLEPAKSTFRVRYVSVPYLDISRCYSFMLNPDQILKCHKSERSKMFARFSQRTNKHINGDIKCDL